MRAAAFCLRSEIVLHRHFFVRRHGLLWCWLEWRHQWLTGDRGWKLVDAEDHGGDEGDEGREGGRAPEGEARQGDEGREGGQDPDGDEGEAPRR